MGHREGEIEGRRWEGGAGSLGSRHRVRLVYHFIHCYAEFVLGNIRYICIFYNFSTLRRCV